MYFWSLTIYREDGSIYHSINDTEIRDEYSIEIGNNSIMSPLVSSVVDETTTIVNAPVEGYILCYFASV